MLAARHWQGSSRFPDGNDRKKSKSKKSKSVSELSVRLRMPLGVDTG